MPVTVDSPIANKTFHSILFKDAEDTVEDKGLAAEMPDFFADLNLNQVVDTLAAGKEEYDLKPFFYTPLQRKDLIIYRQQIMRDLEEPSIYSHIVSFSKNMQEMRKALSYAHKSRYKYQGERLFLDAVKFYAEAVRSLAGHLMQDELESPGLAAFRSYLSGYISDVRFTTLWEETEQLMKDLSEVKYGVHTKDLLVRVLPYQSEADYSREVEATFEKFKQNPVKDYRVQFPASPEMDHVEASILDGVVQLYPDLFHRLDNFCESHKNYEDKTLMAFDREIQFYVAYLEYISKIKETGLPFCYPEISDASKEVSDREGFDLALAYKLVNEHLPVVTNDFYLKGKERIIIVTGPNQGGKTTFARTFGQLHYLASLGYTVPGRQAALFLFDRLLTHFEKEEDISTHRSKFEEDLFRIHAILHQSTSRSIIIMNEILSSTTLQDAIFLSKKIMEKIIQLDALCVWVTFIDELISISDTTVSMTSMVEKGNPAARTFKVVRRAADGLAYALSIAEKYKVTYPYLKERLKP
jgi:DNA mismatch repair ATPase MutS